MRPRRRTWRSGVTAAGSRSTPRCDPGDARRSCARPCWASKRLLEAGDGEHRVYLLPKPGVDGATQIRLTPLELIDRLAKFIPSPRRHLHRYHGVFALHATLRGAVTERAGQAVLRWDEPAPSGPLAQRVRQAPGFSVAMQLLQPESAAPASPGASQWVRLIARLYEGGPLQCPRCGWLPSSLSARPSCGSSRTWARRPTRRGWRRYATGLKRPGQRSHRSLSGRPLMCRRR